MTVVDRDSATGSIGDTNSHTLVVSASNSDYIHTWIDDGTSGNTPASYDFKVEAFSPDENGFKFVWEETGRTDRAWRFDAVGAKCRVTITNQSGGSATYDATAEARSSGE